MTIAIRRGEGDSVSNRQIVDRAPYFSSGCGKLNNLTDNPYERSVLAHRPPSYRQTRLNTAQAATLSTKSGRKSVLCTVPTYCSSKPNLHSDP